MSRKILSLVAAVLVLSMLAACAPAPAPAPVAAPTEAKVEAEAPVAPTEVPAPAPAEVEQVLNAAFTVGPGGGEVEAPTPWVGGAGHTTHAKEFVTPTIYNKDLTDIIPYAAESWESNDDFTVWTFHLRQDIKWSDGQPLTAQDWKFTADFITAPDWEYDRTSQRNLAFQEILGFEERISGGADELEGVQVVDDHTVQVTLSAPNPRFYATQYRTYILPQHAIDFPASEYMSTDWFKNPDKMVGSGPFVLGDYKKDEYMTLVKNPYYFEGEPKLDKIVIRFFQGDITAAVLALAAGEIDFTYLDPTDLETLPADQFNVFSNMSTVIVYLDIHYPNVPEFWQDIRVRQAILYAIDRDAITSQILKKTHYAIPCPVPYPDLWPEDVNWYKYDPEKAKELLAEAGVDPADITMEWVGHAGYDNIMNNSALQAVQAYLSDIGISMTYRFVDVPTFRDRYKADGPWTFHYRGWAYPLYGADPAEKWSNAGAQGGDFKGYDMAATGFEDAIKKIRSAPTKEEYFAAMTDFCKLHNEKLPDLQLWVGNRYGAASKRVANFWWQPAGGGGPYKDDAHLWEIVAP